jgi:hypothetical protein
MPPIDRMALFERDFPKFADASPRLRAIFKKTFDHSKKNGGFFPGLLYVGPSEKAQLLTWFDDREDACEHFVAFASDDLQGLFAFWLADDTVAIDDAPIVYLDPVPPKARAFARSIDDFLALTGIAKKWFGRDNLWAESETDEDERAVEAHRMWLRKDLGIEPILTPTAAKRVVAAARKAHPDVAPWIESWKAKRAKRARAR